MSTAKLHNKTLLVWKQYFSSLSQVTKFRFKEEQKKTAHEYN